MKQLLLIPIAALLLFACKKDNKDANIQTPDDYHIHFKANGQSIVYDGTLNQQTGGVSASRYPIFQTRKQLMLYAARDGNNWVMIYFNVDSVQAGQTYTLQQETTGAVQTEIDGKPFNTMPISVYSPAALNVMITKHAEGWISGTFSGKIARNNGNGTYEELTITDGSFSSKVVYE
jgi:hypothetical protein